MTFECPDECGKTYGSIKAAMLCQCSEYDKYGYELDADHVHPFTD